MKAGMHSHLISFVMTASIAWVGAGCGNQEQQGRCFPGVCSGHGQCVDNGESVVCVCDSGYAGNQCQDCADGYFLEGNDTCAKADACQPDSCNSHGECQDDNGDVECVCHRGYTGDKCQDCAAGFREAGDGTCVPDDECGPTSCSGHGTCDDSGSGIVCTCDQGYAGESCERCATGFHPDGSACVVDRRCQANSCSGHGECDDSGGIITCTCDPGYTGEICDGCADGFHTSTEGDCVPDEHCQADSCSERGACDDSSGETVCTCQDGYAGLICERCAPGYHDDGNGVCLPDQTCGPNTCNGHGTCDDSAGTISCTCEPEYTGAHCESCQQGFQDNDQNGSCLPSCATAALNCGTHGTCQDASGVATCVCSSGYAGDRCESCDDGYQDADGNGSCLPTCTTAGLDCGEHGDCSHASGVARCDCETGYTGANCLVCDQGYQDNDFDGSCLPGCVLADLDCGGHGACDDLTGTAQCVCDTGYTGDQCQSCSSGYQDNDGNGSCLPTCATEGLDCGTHGECRDESGLALCVCDTGYTGSMCQTCASGYQDNDGNGSCLPDCDLVSPDCGAHGHCEDASGSALCVCDSGYTGSACESCADGYQDHDGNGTCLPGCDLANIDCGTHGHCEDASGLALCVCDTGYTGANCQYCANGYQDNDGDGTCLPTCSLSGLDCGEHGQCDDSTGVAHCDCDTGYQGNLCQSCAAGFHLEGDLCVPDDAWCGNHYVDGYEECDGAADSACPGHCSTHCACPTVSPRDRLEIHMIDVGQGDAILVVSPDGFVMLVDAGNYWEDSTIIQYLDDEGIGSLDYTLVSHLHADHLGGMDGVLGSLPTVACFDNGGSYYTDEYDAYDQEAGDRRVMLNAGDSIDLGPSVQVNVLHGHTGANNENLNTVVVRITYGSTRVLLGGDCEAECEDDFDPGPIDVYKVHHHGSSDSSSESFLSQMEPEFALIPVGYANPYGHPHSYTLDRLSDHSVTVYRTDLDSDIRVNCDGQNCTYAD